MPAAWLSFRAWQPRFCLCPRMMRTARRYENGNEKWGHEQRKKYAALSVKLKHESSRAWRHV